MKLTLLLFFVCFVQNAHSAVSKTKFPVNDLSRETLLAELTGKDLGKQDDRSIFSQIVLAYQTEDRIRLEYALEKLLKKFPKSPLADNALYLVGLYHLNRKNYGLSIKYFNKVKEQYPNSDKFVSALFAKAMAYKIMGIPEFSKPILLEVFNNYKGSPESFRAEVELRLFKN